MPYPSSYSINPTEGTVESGDIVWPLLAPSGSKTAPSYSWEDDPDTGWYRDAITPGIHWSVGGNTNGRLVEGGLTLYDTDGNTSFGAGTSGMFSKAANTYQFQTNSSGSFFWNDARLVSTASLGWNPDSNPLTAADTFLSRASAGVVQVQDDLKTGGLLVASAAKTGTYTVAAGDSVIECDASSAAFTVNLPAAASHDGRVIYVKKADSSANAVTIDGNASETIDGATTVDILLQYECLQLVCNGTGWSVV